MSGPTLAAIYRHPIKSVGAERLAEVELTPGERLPHDRVWAITHGGTEWNPADPKWMDCKNFVRQTHEPELARLQIEMKAERGVLQAAHPLRPPLMCNISFSGGQRGLVDWLEPILGQGRPGPYRVVRLEEGGLTDAEEPWISIASTRSLTALEQRVGRPLAHIRFRANLWIDGLDPWEEFDLIGRELTIGATRVRIMEPIERCRATEASPETGTHDAPVLACMREAVGEPHFAVYGAVIEGGRIAEGDAVSRA